MELSDGSDVEEGGHVSEELDEDDLLGPSDEEDQDIDVSNVRGGRFSSSESFAPKEQPECHNQSIDAEEEFLDLALGDEEDGLELAPEDSETPSINPVKVKVRAAPAPTSEAVPAPELPEVKQPPNPNAAESDENAESEEQDQDYGSTAKGVKADDDDDDDDDKKQRSRFLNERPPPDGHISTSSNYMGNPQPIRTLGDHVRFGNQYHYGAPRMRGNMRPRGMMPNHLQIRRGIFRGGPRQMIHRQPIPRMSINNMNNRPDFRPPEPEIPVSQCSGQLFIDFNQPIQTQAQIKSQAAPVPPSLKPRAPLQPELPASVPPAQRQGVGIVRPQQHPQPAANQPRPPQRHVNPKPLPTPARYTKPRITDEKRNTLFPPPPQHQQPQRPVFVPPQQFQPPPHLPMRPPIFMPNQQPVYMAQQQMQNFIPPNSQLPPMIGNFSFGGPARMMMRPPGHFDYNNVPPHQEWVAQPHFGGPSPQFSGMPPVYFPPQQQPMNHFTPEQHFLQEQNMNMMVSYGFSPQFPPQAVHEKPQPVRESVDTRQERYSYDRERERRYDDYYRHATKRRQDDEYRGTSKYHRYEDSRYEYEESQPSSSSTSTTTAASAADSKKAMELVKIIVESKKEMGIDDEYMNKIEEQKRKRDEIMRKKGKKMEEAEAHKTKNSNSIYVNPAAFKGDLSLLNSHLKGISMTAKTRTTLSPSKLKPKPKTILRVTKNSKGEVIHMEKLLKVEKTKTTAKK